MQSRFQKIRPAKDEYFQSKLAVIVVVVKIPIKCRQYKP